MQKQSEYNKRSEERKKAKGQERVVIWIYTAYKQKIKDYVKQINTKYEEEVDNG
tara:strand:- start:140 stop:301 length:162 start_codon:yes stop_codon:yes gene_type:complete